MKKIQMILKKIKKNNNLFLPIMGKLSNLGLQYKIYNS